jgi:DNA-binding response OmpR family regulator
MAGNEKKKVLLVDDDDIQLTTAELFLKDEYEIYKSMSGKEAIKKLSGNEIHPDIIMLDIMMPEMDGWEIFNRVRAINSFKNTPIVFLTSLAGDAEKKRAQKIGAADYIVKPFVMTELKSRMKEALKKNK